MVIKTCRVEDCKFTGEESYFRKGKNICITCDRKRLSNYYSQNKKKILSRMKIYNSTYIKTSKYKENRKKYMGSVKYKNFIKEKLKNNIQFKLSKNMRRRISKCVQNKTESSSNLLGCPIDLFIEWIEFNFDENMSWDNYGKYWHLDHVKPCASFNLIDTDQQYICFNWTNIFPLKGKDNESKGDKIIPEYIKYVKKRYKLFMKKIHVVDVHD